MLWRLTHEDVIGLQNTYSLPRVVLILVKVLVVLLLVEVRIAAQVEVGMKVP